MENYVLINGVTKTFPNNFKALDQLDLSINQGEIFALLGPNGAGKSTLIHTICGILNFESGKILVDNFDIKINYRQTKTLIGIVPQELNLEVFETVWNNVNYSRGLYGKPNNHQYIENLLKELSLWDKKDNKLRELSGGMKRRVFIAKALSHEPKVLFLDEPTVGLDPTARRQLLDFLKNKVKEKNLTIFYTTHVLTEAEYLCDNIAIINKGKIITVDSPNELKKRFGREKTIKIHVSSNTETLGSLLENIQDCKIEFNTGAIITIHSADSELVLMNILKILNQNNIAIDDLSAIPTNLEEIFLKIVSDSNASDNQTS